MKLNSSTKLHLSDKVSEIKMSEPLIFQPKIFGKVTKISGMKIEASGLKVSTGTVCEILSSDHKNLAEVTSFSHDAVSLMAINSLGKIRQGDLVRPVDRADAIAVSQNLVGRIIDPLGQPIDHQGEVVGEVFYPLHSKELNPLKKEKIIHRMDVGIKCINGLLTTGQGQRVGIFSGSGVGKSVLLGMMTRFSKADVIVIGLVGERGREVKEFIEENLGDSGLKRSVVIAAPAGNSPIMRARGALVATTIAEYFRDCGKHVLLIIDSITRYAQALREIASSTGELPAARGYGVSVFSALSKIVERAGMGTSEQGSITAYYTVLVEGDDHDEPISDHMRSILDGHIFLSRELSNHGHYPAIDVLRSVSRLMKSIVSPEHWNLALEFKKLYSEYEKYKEMILMGMYQGGRNALIDKAINLKDKMDDYLQQNTDQSFSIEQCLSELKGILQSI